MQELMFPVFFYTLFLRFFLFRRGCEIFFFFFVKMWQCCFNNQFERTHTHTYTVYGSSINYCCIAH